MPATAVFDSRGFVDVSIGVEADEDYGAVSQIHEEFHHSSVVAKGFVSSVLVLVDLDNDDVATEINAKIGSAKGTSVCNAFVDVAGEMGKLG